MASERLRIVTPSTVDKAMTDAAATTGSQFATQQDAKIAAKVNEVAPAALAAAPSVAAAAATAVTAAMGDRSLLERFSGDPLYEAQWVWYAAYSTGEIAFGQRVNGSFYPSVVGASFADQSVAALSQTQGWSFAIYYESGEVAFGQRTNGTFYPDTLGGATVASKPVVRQSGDSLTAGWASYTAGLKALIGLDIITEGDGGHSSPWIASRQGGQPLRLTSSTGQIPTSGPVSVTMVDYNHIGGTPAGYPNTSLYGSWGNRAGTLTITNGVGSFTPASTAARPTPVGALTPFIRLSYRDAWPIIWAGRNNFKLANDSAQIVRDVGDMLKWTNVPDRALVLSIPPWVGEELGTGGRTTLDAVNTALKDNFPTQYVGTAAMLRSAELISAVGLTPTATDLQNITDGLTPESFRGDAGHLNAKGYEALNILIYEIYKSRGWI